MYFRLCNLLVIFQLIISTVKTHNVTVYINVILIFTKTIENHYDVVDQVLAILEKNKLAL